MTSEILTASCVYVHTNETLIITTAERVISNSNVNNLFEIEMMDALNQLMAAKPYKYCFIRCLHQNDQEEFKKHMVHHICNECNNDIDQIIDQLSLGSMNMGIWRSIMQLCRFEYRYNLYRNAYRGEHSGRKHVHTWLTKLFQVRVDVFDHAPEIAEDDLRDIYLKYSLGKKISPTGTRVNGKLYQTSLFFITPARNMNMLANNKIVWDNEVSNFYKLRIFNRIIY